MNNDIILQTSVALGSALLISQIITAFLIRKNPQKDYEETILRTRSWWIIIICTELALYLGKTTFITFVAFLSFFALREFLSRAHTRKYDRPVLGLLFLAIPIQFYLINKGMFIGFLTFVPLYTMSVVVFALLLAGPPRGFVTALGTSLLALLCTVYSFGHLAYLGLSPDPNNTEIMAGSILLPIFLTQVNDVFQYMSGKLFGRHKIMPHISPKKTVQGFAGGIILTSCMAALVAPYFTDLNRVQGLFAGLTLASLGFLGDVLMSAIKRDLDIKDFSTLLPGHGGILDRMDSLIIGIPIYFHLVQAFHGGFLA
jgi:phosphatidate cytidylyltransferase